MNQKIMYWLRTLWHFIIRNYFVFFWVPVYAYMGLMFQVSSVPNPLEALPGAELAVKLFSTWASSILHIVEYFVLSMLLGVAFRHSRHNFFVKHSFLLAFIISALFGMSDEIHQLFVPGRFCTISDIGFDSLGALAAQVARKIVKLEKNYLDKIF